MANDPKPNNSESDNLPELAALVLEQIYNSLAQHQQEDNRRKEYERVFVADKKTGHLTEDNRQIEKYQDARNGFNNKVGETLITISAGLLALIGGFIFSNGLNASKLSGTDKLILTEIMALLLISRVAGLFDYFAATKFWEGIANHIKKETGIIAADRSVNVKDLEALETRIKAHRADTPNRGTSVPRIIQFLAFGAALIFIMLLAILKLYT
jgi:hypothetical protein